MSIIGRAVLLLQSKNYSAGLWLDESGNSHDATPLGPPTFAFGVFTLNGIDQYFTVANHTDLNFAAAEPFTLMVMGATSDNTPAGNESIVNKRTAGNAGYVIINRAAGANAQFTIADGVAQPSDQSANLVNDQRFVLAGVRNVINDDIEVFLDGVGSGSPAADSTGLTLTNILALTIGARDSGADQFYAGEIHAVVLWREALSDADVVTAGNELLFGIPRRVIRSPRYGITRMARR